MCLVTEVVKESCVGIWKSFGNSCRSVYNGILGIIFIAIDI